MFTIVETQLFTRLVGKYLDDDEYAALQAVLVGNPEAGVVIPGTGGVRKVRWATGGRGKRGGVRVIYFVRRHHGVIWMLDIYAKSVREDVSAKVLRRVREEIEDVTP